MSRYIDLEDAKACIRNYGKQAIDSGRNDLDAVDDIVLMVEALDVLSVYFEAKTEGETK